MILTREWKRVSVPAVIRIIPQSIAPIIDWVEVDKDDPATGPLDGVIFSTYKQNHNEPLSIGVVDAWIRTNEFSHQQIDVQIRIPVFQC